MAALRRAITIKQMNDIPVRVANDLNLDMPAVWHKTLQHDTVITECRLCFTTYQLKCTEEAFGILHNADPSPTAAATRLYQERKTDVQRRRHQNLVPLIFPIISRHSGDTLLHCQVARPKLRAHRNDDINARPYEHQTSIGASLRKHRVLRQETIARVDCIRSRLQRDSNQLLRHQIAVPGIGRPNGHGLITCTYMQCIPVRVGIHSNRTHAPLAAGCRNTTGYLAAVGDQYLVYHARHEGTVLFRKDLMPSRPHSVSHASARRSAVYWILSCSLW